MQKVLAPWNWFKPSSKIFYWPLQAALLLWIFYVYSVLCLLCFVRFCLYVPCGHLLGKGWPLASRLWCLIVSLSLSYWYPGSGVVLDGINSWSLHLYLLWINTIIDKFIYTINDFVCIRIMGWHPFLCHDTPIFQLISTPSNLEFIFNLFQSLSRYHFNPKAVYICL